MTMKLSPTQIKEIAERAEKATPGPWLIGTHQILDADGKHVLWAAKPNNRDFTAHARQDIPALLAHIAAQDEESRRFYRADGTFETLATAEEVVAKRKEAAAKIAKLERERDEAKKKLRVEEEEHAQLQSRCFEGYPSASDGIFDYEKQLAARIAQLESLLAVKDGALRVIANGEIVLPGGTPVEIAREALKGSA